MIHKKEWTTCDRCGGLIDNSLLKLFNMPPTTNAKVCVTEYTPRAYIKNLENETMKIGDLFHADSIEVGLYTEKKSKKYELCNKCKKDFRRFMRNDIFEEEKET